MAYSAGDTILDDEYNTFVNSSSDPYGYNHIAGTGSGAFGLGQSAISTVSAGGTVQASQWNSLFTGMTNIANHVNTTLNSVAAVSAGDSIAIKGALVSDLAQLATDVSTGSPNATALSTSSALATVTTSSEGWDSTAEQEVKATFSNANEMRWFFNAGGKLRLVVSATAASVSAKDTAFVALGAGIGNLDLGSQATTRSASGQATTTSGLTNGFHDLGTGYTSLIKLTQDSYAAYDSATLEIFAKLNASVGSATELTFKMVATDPTSDTQYTSGNTDGIPVGVKDTPKMVSTLFSIDPTTAQGLDPVYTPASGAQVSNSTT